jgi:hypothetical protein
MSPPRHSKLSPLGSGDDHVDLSASASGTNEPLAPIEHGRVRTVSGNHLDGVRLDLVAARLAPHDQPDAGRGRVAERHWRAEW